MSCIFVFAPDGKIRICSSFNSPGCWHDSTQADHGGICDKIEAIRNATGEKQLAPPVTYRHSTVMFH
jgi:hypothetical protein